MKSLVLFPLVTAVLTTTAYAAPNVVVSIKPLHSLVAAVMDGVGEPQVLVRGNASPHSYALRPSDAGALESADLVFWTGHGLELFLAEALDTLALEARVVEVAETPGLSLLPIREGGSFEAHAHEDHADEHDHSHEDDAGHADHDHEHEHAEPVEDEAHDHTHEDGASDMHFWLDPQNAKVVVEAIAEELIAIDPENEATYAANAAQETAELDALTEELAATLAPVANAPFVVFHDAYQYFENRFDLTVAGSITVSPEVAPGAQRIGELKSRVAELGAACVFAEPQFEPAIIASIIEGSDARSGVLDPEGGLLTEGPDLYPELLRAMAASLVDCMGD